MNQDDTSSFVRCTILIALKQELRKESIKTDDRKPLLDAFQLVHIRRHNRIPNYTALFKLRCN
jgi:hypothetical protein